MAAGVAGAGADGINSTPPVTEDQGVDQERMDYELLRALRRGDAGFVKNLFLRATKASVAEVRQVTIELLGAGSFTEAADTIFRGVTAGRNSALHVAAEFGHLELANFICDKDRSLLAAQNAALETPLHCAARAGAHRILCRFISVAESEGVSRSVAVLHATDRQGKTALYTAAQEGHAAAARVLMSADPGLAAIVDRKGVSPLYVAALSGSLEVVQVLLGEQVRAPAGVATPEASFAGPNGQTALHAAALIENPEIAGKILQWKSTLAKKADNLGSTPLHYLATTFNTNMVGQLLNHDTTQASTSQMLKDYVLYMLLQAWVEKI